ncbi:FAD binding domain-containing protein [Cohnella nanjingensis]|uniref:FAD binding domain-containing protein n=1 Tax=Cohnella nanjingensis TaxID=1387779 RepID=A0A7X0RYC3_9BACL|nr:FAD binding domain-containing protein [Cohnella nanjingensis]MBB6674716.1 FAD binding domain-containing protein [Cohnella nanjingensis]
MIPYPFDYYQPATVGEAVALFVDLDARGKQPLYFSGGTEIITLGRINEVYTEAVIDVKRIPDCREIGRRSGAFVWGAALTLSEIHDARLFPLLGETGAGVADRTSRNKITLGGNVCGRFIYKEAVLPLLLTDSPLRIAGPGGERTAPIGQLFDRTLRLGRGELLVQAMTDVRYAAFPYVTDKRRKGSAIDYPLLTVAAIRAEEGIRLAFSGVCAFPFRSTEMELILNRREVPAEERIATAIARLPAPILNDIKGSALYREYVLKVTLGETLERLEKGVAIG